MSWAKEGAALTANWQAWVDQFHSGADGTRRVEGKAA
jgi:hypothetical protein